MKLKQSILRSRIESRSVNSGPQEHGVGEPLDPSIDSALVELAKGDQSLENYLNPNLFEDPATVQDIAMRLQAGEMVTLHDAFRPEFAEMVHRKIEGDNVRWDLAETYTPDFTMRMHKESGTHGHSWLNLVHDVFTDAASNSFIQNLTGRDCSGGAIGSFTWYQEGDYLMPHNDWLGQRTVAFIWQLSKNWKPEWGGAFYWGKHSLEKAFNPPSFNTLVLFPVTKESVHLVTPVTPHHRSKRLAFSGWWHAAWELPSVDGLEEMLSSKAKRAALTHTQVQTAAELLTLRQGIPTEQHERLQRLYAQLMQELYPDASP